METFKKYSTYYDLLYRDKDYAAEAAYVARLLRQLHPSCHSVLELGCGTGRHAEHLADKGFEITGIDLSAKMVSLARQRTHNAAFLQADVRSFNGSGTFDAVIALFHVMSYQQTGSDLHMTFQTISKHLESGGAFLFDCWHAPAVLSDQPVQRHKEIEDEKLKIVRRTNPMMKKEQPVVSVHFDVEVTDKKTGKCTTFSETHNLRYLFSDEVKQLCDSNGLELTHRAEWMSGKSLSDNTWYACYGGHKR